MSLLAVLEAIAHKLPFQSEEEKAAFHSQIHALGDEAVSDVRTLVHGVEADAASDLTMETLGAPVPAAPAPAPAAPAPAAPPVQGVVDTSGDQSADPLAGIDTAALQAELAKREAQAQ